jgi:hypothetical protein
MRYKIGYLLSDSKSLMLFAQPIWALKIKNKTSEQPLNDHNNLFAEKIGNEIKKENNIENSLKWSASLFSIT